MFILGFHVLRGDLMWWLLEGHGLSNPHAESN